MSIPAKRFLPVIHLSGDPAQAVEQATLARECGADGVWLISHSGDAEFTLRALSRVCHRHPDFWVGVNLLGHTSHSAMNIVTTLGAKGTKIDGLWADKSGVTDMYVSQGARQAWSYKRETAWDGEYFGGVAFKYQEPVNDVALAAKKANEYMDVVTTSGVATGSAPDLDKIRWMSTEANRLAIASGLTPENIGEFVEWASDFLVATGISKNFHELDPDKAKAFAAIVHGQL